MSSKSRSIISYLGIFVIIIGVIMLLPIVVALFYPAENDQIIYFLIPGMTSVIIGGLLYFLNKKYHDYVVFDRNSFWLIVLIWILAILLTAIPFAMLDLYNFTHAVFEATSGLSTTGLSVMDVSITSNLFLFYRSELQFFGGVGLVLVFVSLLSKQNSYAIYTAEGHSDQLSPNLVASARRIVGIYLLYITIGTILLSVSSMSIFDAINHSVAAISTGGFSTQVTSILHFNNLFVEIVIIVLMVLGGTNFLVHAHLLTGKIKDVLKHNELFYMLGVFLVLIPAMTLYVSQTQAMPFFESLRITTFQLISASTTTGYSTINDFLGYSSIFVIVVIVLMVIGGGIGSTAGGFKQFRFILLIKSIYWYFLESITSKRYIYNKRVHKVDKKEDVTDKMLRNTFVFGLLYLIMLFVGVVMFSHYGFTMQESLFESASALGTVGLSVGLFGYSSPPVILWMGSVMMLLGRLEILIVLIVIINFFRKLKNKNQTG
ncbi:MAG: TrkH family potassium uptake protein [Candidatus Izimaplasma sp.]|nr:TrkH family potassium uptake protein [Candidatus Izimaplasma bacterium]